MQALPESLALLLALQAPPGTYTNPVHDRDFPDPHVIRHDGQFYAYATQSGADRFQVMQSPDLVRWTPLVLDFDVPWSKDHLWAPEVHVRDGTFYMTYSALDPESKKHHIGIATASSPTGPFTHRALLVRGRLTLEDLNEQAPILVPLSLHGYNHFVVYRGMHGNRVLLADPAWGNRTMLVERFEKVWIDAPEVGKVGFVVARRDGRAPPNRLAPQTRDFVMLR